MLFCLASVDLRRELEEFRIEYEAAYGATDMTKYYTSLRPIDEQEWMIAHTPKHYFDGLPAFVQAYLKGKVDLLVGEGRLDDAPDHFVKLFVQGHMHAAGNSGRRDT